MPSGWLVVQLTPTQSIFLNMIVKNQDGSQHNFFLLKMLAPSLFPFHSDHGFRHLFDHYDKGVRGGYQSTWGLIDDLDDGPSWSTRSRLECATTCSTMDGCTSAWFRPNGACVLGIFRVKIIILLIKWDYGSAYISGFKNKKVLQDLNIFLTERFLVVI